MINLSDTTPPAPLGGNNVHFQEDASGNVSAYIKARKVTVNASSGTLTIDASQADTFLIQVTAAVTAMSITNPADGQIITLLWAQDTNGHTVALASNLLGALAVSTTANKHTCQAFTYNSGDTNWYAIGVAGM